MTGPALIALIVCAAVVLVVLWLVKVAEVNARIGRGDIGIAVQAVRTWLRRVAYMLLRWTGEACGTCGAEVTNLTTICSYCVERERLDADLAVMERMR